MTNSNGWQLLTFHRNILTETSHQRRLTNKYECKVTLSSSKYSKNFVKTINEAFCKNVRE